MKKINDTLFNSWLYIANGIISDFFEQNVYPSVHDIKDNWRYRYNNIHITDSAIEKIIENVSKYYN